MGVLLMLAGALIGGGQEELVFGLTTDFAAGFVMGAGIAVTAYGLAVMVFRQVS